MFGGFNGGFDRIVLRCFFQVPRGEAVERNQHHSKLRAHGISFREDAHDFGWSRVGGDVIIRGFTPEQQVAYTSAHEVGFVPALSQGANDVNGGFLHKSIVEQSQSSTL